MFGNYGVSCSLVIVAAQPVREYRTTCSTQIILHSSSTGHPHSSIKSPTAQRSISNSINRSLFTKTTEVPGRIFRWTFYKPRQRSTCRILIFFFLPTSFNNNDGLNNYQWALVDEYWSSVHVVISYSNMTPNSPPSFNIPMCAAHFYYYHILTIAAIPFFIQINPLDLQLKQLCIRGCTETFR